MKTHLILSVVAAGLAGIAFAGGDTPQPQVIQIDHEKVAAAFAKGGPLLETNNFKIQAGRRVSAPGTVEIHEHDTDIFYILDGTATIVTGGVGLELKTVSPGEIRGKEITGGETHQLAKGDVFVIPKTVPHWFTKVSDPFLYFVVKVTQ